MNNKTNELPLVDQEENTIDEYILSQESTKKVFGIRTTNQLLPKVVHVFQWKEKNSKFDRIIERVIAK